MTNVCAAAAAVAQILRVEKAYNIDVARADGWRLRERLVLAKKGGVKEVSIDDAPAPRDTEQRLAARKLSPVYCVPVL